MSRVLFIGIDYYDYGRQIRDTLRALGHDCVYRPIEKVGFVSKTFKKLAPAAARRRLDAYHRRIIEASASETYDTIFFLQVHHMSRENMERLRALHPQARTVLYNWDSLTTHDYRPWLPYFDRAFTFDPVDAKALGIGLLPLFAIRPFFEIDRDRAKDFDLYFVGAIGTMHRFDALARLHAFCEAEGLRLKLHLKCSPVIRFQLLRTGRRLPGVTSRSLGFEEIVDLMERSQAVFDFANHRQSGYTMRFIENMCAGKKIVTENARVLEEDFYRPDRFLITDGSDFSRLKEFLRSPIRSELDTERFSIENWARTVLEG
jgi:hypothetical protein